MLFITKNKQTKEQNGNLGSLAIIVDVVLFLFLNWSTKYRDVFQESQLEQLPWDLTSPSIL